jgi:hypothetical protein
LKNSLNKLRSDINHFPIEYKGEKIIIYGAGQMGNAVSLFLHELKACIECFVDRNKNLNGQKVNNIPVIHPDQITEYQKQNCIFAISTVKLSFSELSEYLSGLGCKRICYVGDLIQELSPTNLISNLWTLGELTNEEEYKLIKCYDSLYDNESKSAFKQCLMWFALHREAENLIPISSPDEKYFIPEVLSSINNNEVFIDTASLGGEYISKIISITKNNFRQIHSFELSLECHNTLVDRFKGDDRINIYEYELGEREQRIENARIGLMYPYCTLKKHAVVSKRLDEIVPEISVSYFRCYSIGLCYNILDGSKNVLQKNRPIIAVNIGHYRFDFINIIPWILDNLPDYRILFRHHGYYGNDSIIYGIPNERWGNF